MAKEPRQSDIGISEESAQTETLQEKRPKNGNQPTITTEPSVTRRAVLGGGVFGTLSLLAQACSDSDFAGGGILAKDKPRKPGDAIDAGDGDSGDGDDAGDGADQTDGNIITDGDGEDGGGDGLGSDGGGDSAPDFDTVEDLDPCRANNTKNLDASKHPEPPSDLQPLVKFYGKKSGSSMVAFQFDTTKNIESITLAMDSGQLIAFQRLTGGDKDGENYRAIQIDNCFLATTKNVIFVIKSDGKNYKYSVKIDYFDTYKGKPVLDYASHTIPAGYTMDKQSVTQFDSSATDPNFNVDDTVVYPAADGNLNGAGARSLLTANKATVWTPGAGVQGEVTDIMGNPISLAGTNICKYQTFCTYVLDDSSNSYCRTIMKIG